jgi:2-keto-3-deoxy-6-phosphogluconate aldolase
MTNLRIEFPEINLIPSGGINPQTDGEVIRSGAAAISGARNFLDRELVEQHGLGWITDRTAEYIRIVANARAEAPPLP